MACLTPRIAIAVLALAATPALAAPERIEIILANFSYTPAAIHLHASRPVTLHLVNQGSGGHDFMAPDFFAGAAIDAASRRLIDHGKVGLGKGEAVDVTLTPTAGKYALHCSHFLHTSFGMKGEIIVD